MLKFNVLTNLIIFCLLQNFSFADEINPFTPKIKPPNLNEGEDAYIDPLKKWELFQYDLIGVVLSKKRQLALLETPEGEIYTLLVGNKIGKSDNKVTEILIDRLILNSVDEKELILKNHKF